MTAVCEGAVQAVLDTVPPRICVVDAHARLIIPQVIAPFCVSSSPVQEGAIVSIGTNSRRLVVFGAVVVGAVVEGAVAASHRASTPLVHEMPVKTGEWTMLCTFVL
jgi:hypothetical protein